MTLIKHLTKQQLDSKVYEMESELSFLWKEALEEPNKELQDRKIRQYWGMYRVFRKQREFLFALADVGSHRPREFTIEE